MVNMINLMCFLKQLTIFKKKAYIEETRQKSIRGWKKQEFRK